MTHRDKSFKEFLFMVSFALSFFLLSDLDGWPQVGLFNDARLLADCQTFGWLS